MTTKPTPPLTAMRLVLMLEDAHGEGRVEPSVFSELSEDYAALCRENGPLERARAAAASWEGTVLEQTPRVALGTCHPETFRASGVCLAHALSELGRWEREAAALKKRLWAALVAATLRPIHHFTHNEEHHEA